MIRLATAALLFVLPALVHAAETDARARAAVDPELGACRLLTQAELEPYLGAPVTIRESHLAPRGVTSCHWRGARDGVLVNVSLFPQGSAGVEDASPEQVFEAAVEARRATVGAEGIQPLTGIGDKAYSTFKAASTRSHQAYLLRHGASATLATYGLDNDRMEALARLVADKM